MELPKAYNPADVEGDIYQRWEQSGFFNPDNLPGDRAQAFTISMPPPNATGVLHIGHAEFITIQDVVIRYQRMAGKKALWLPGTDHASIATQAKVERVIKEQEGKSRHDLGREDFLKRVDAFVADSQTTIRNQVRKMGASCDWSRERFTLDEGLSRAVREAFVRMYNDGLIYRGYRIVNWCPNCKSTLADDEVEYKTERTPFYYFKYGPVVIGTARPETKFGDKVIIVHPDDPRYQNLIAEEFEVDWIMGPIKARVIADPVADMEMGSGAMTITPAHSFTDFDLAQKYNLPIEKIIDEDGKLTAAAGEYAGLSVKDARKKVVEILTEKGLVDHIDEDYSHNLSVCYRCGTAIEPLPSLQWFVNVNKSLDKFGGKTIKDRATEVVKNGEIKIIPERFEKTYYDWMGNLHDWCISRQIWYGHRIPVWYKGEEIFVGTAAPEGEGWTQDSDTLDTWFSSGLWTFSTLGWPDKTKDLETFHPTDLMETGYDIIFFWVARMIIMSTYLVDQVPFKNVYLHGLVRDEKGRKMSKSLGNTIDPLDVSKKYGADATRLSLLIGVTPGNDLNLSEQKIEGYRNFVNKLWNISRYVLTTIEQPRIVTERPEPKTLADKWILSELDTLIADTTSYLEKYQFSLAGERVYEFTWNKFADWYLEVAKIEKGKDDILLYVLQTLLKLWHPITPFVTEHLWALIGGKEMLMVQSWPVASASALASNDFGVIRNIISEIRSLRQESGIAPAEKLQAIIIASEADLAIVRDQQEIIMTLGRLSSLEAGEKPAQSLSAIVGNYEIYLPVAGTLDITKEVSRIEKEIAQLQRYIDQQQGKLGNAAFVANAPAEIVEAERAKIAEAEQRIEKMNQQVSSLK